ncbi:MAG: hypothetical protein HYU27_00625 [Acidobacteria bacterium]|nr:hypothetical protein [Acidobacteriota bacterium]
MMYRAFILGFVLMLGSSLESYPQTPPQKPAQPPQGEPPPVFSVPKDYKYNRRGRRDPFVNPIPEEKPVSAGPAAPPPPIQRPPGLAGVLIAEAGITAVVVSREPAMTVVGILAPGGKTYFARVGDELFDAVVKEIRMEAVRFTVKSGGEKTTREVVRRVGVTSGENK